MAKKTTAKKATKSVSESSAKTEIKTPPVENASLKVSKDRNTIIQENAYLLSLQPRSIDDWNWQLAEIRLKKEKIANITDDMIRIRASEIANENLSLDKIHWEIAEKSK